MSAVRPLREKRSAGDDMRGCRSTGGGGYLPILQEPRIAAAGTLPAVFFAQAARLGNRVALRRKEFGIWRRITWADYARSVRWVAHALLALGIRGGERVAVIGENRPEWLVRGQGILAAGRGTVGVYATHS